MDPPADDGCRGTNCERAPRRPAHPFRTDAESETATLRLALLRIGHGEPSRPPCGSRVFHRESCREAARTSPTGRRTIRVCSYRLAASDDGALIKEVRTVTKVLLIAIRRRERSLIESHFGGTGHSYSQRIAIIGSTFVARRAGIQQASRATNVNNSVMAPNVIGSTALTPNSMFDISRVSENEAASPRATPLATNFIP